MTNTRVTELSVNATDARSNRSGHATVAKKFSQDWDVLPDQLREAGQFVVWRNKGGRKIPYSPHNPAKCASSTDPSTWADFKLARSVCNTFHFDGIHAVCSPQFVFIDIDDCIKDGHISESAVEIIESLPPTYWEVSPSGKGVHGVVTLKRGMTFRNIVKGQGKNDVEVYADKHFMSCTASRLSDTSEIANVDSAQLEKFRISKRAKRLIESDSPIPQGERHNALVKLAGGMRRQGADLSTIEAGLRQHNARCSPPLDEKEILSIAKSAGKWDAGAGSLLKQELKDTGNADRLLVYGDGNFRYVAAYKRWVVFDSKRWPAEDREQETIRVSAHAMVRSFGAQAFQAEMEEEEKKTKIIKFAAESLNSVRITNLLREAQPHAILRIDELDRDPFLVNFQNGTFDVRTGKLREHRREDYITSVLAYNYNPEAACPLWEEFIAETFRRDHELVQFVQRALGYSLTGDTSEKSIIIAYGPTGTAKTTLLVAVKTLLGDYAGRIKVESLMVERGKALDANAQSDLADLRGKRFVMTSETGQGQRLREDLVKLLSQGQGDYRAVRKYENPFSFRETWKIWMDCNHLPVVYGTDDAIWERLIVIPFLHQVPRSKQNPNLGQQLIATEAEGILAWLIRGLGDWCTNRFTLPKAVREQREQWRTESDDLGQWLQEECVLDPKASAATTPLYRSCQTWRERNGMKAESTQLFARKMKEHGFAKKEIGHDKTPHWIGVGLKEAPRKEKF